MERRAASVHLRRTVVSSALRHCDGFTTELTNKVFNPIYEIEKSIGNGRHIGSSLTAAECLIVMICEFDWRINRGSYGHGKPEKVMEF